MADCHSRKEIIFVSLEVDELWPPLIQRGSSRGRHIQLLKCMSYVRVPLSALQIPRQSWIMGRIMLTQPVETPPSAETYWIRKGRSLGHSATLRYYCRRDEIPMSSSDSIAFMVFPICRSTPTLLASERSRFHIIATPGWSYKVLVG